MRRWILLAIISLAWTPGPARAQGGEYKRKARPTLVWALSELERIEGMASGCVDGKKIRKRLARVRRHLGYLVPGRGRAAPAPAARPRPTARPISSGNLARLLGAVRTQRFSQGKVRIIRQAAARNRFTCRQVAILVRAFTLDEYRLKVLRLLARRVTDKKNAALVHAAFTNPRDRRKAQKILPRTR